MKLVLKVDVDTLHGTLEGVPRLMDLLQRHDAPATFLFSLGPDHTGRAIRRVLRPGFLSKVSRTSVLEHYGLRTLLYGTLLPGPDIGRRCAPLLREVATRGFEVGVHCWDHNAWQDRLASAGDDFACRQLQQAQQRFTEIFGRPAHIHGAAGWQMNDAALRCAEQLGFTVLSDTRGGAPFRPVVAGRVLDCVQLPTTLPTLDELMGRDDPAGADPVAWLLRLTAAAATDQVYTLHAELEGRRLAGWFERLLQGWRDQGHAFATLGQLADSLDWPALPARPLRLGSVDGRAGTLAA